MKTKFWAWLTLVLAALQILLILVSWIVSSATQQTYVHSLLSSEGIRWFMGRFSENLATPVLVWLLVAAIAYGVLRTSGLAQAIADLIHGKRPSYRQRFALTVSMVLLILVILVVFFLTCTSHAVLLSATGKLFPSSFSRALIPIVAFTVTILSVVYGLLSTHFLSWQQVFEGMTEGIRQTLPLWIVYLFAAQLIQSLIYAFA